MGTVEVATTVEALRGRVGAWRAAGERTALVPTMGALHEGHVSLVRLARRHAERVVVSIFVNPTQFAPNEDFAQYPRTFEADRAQLAGLADLVWAPPVAAMYPPGFATTITLAGPASADLEDAVRPTHFAGVATVVAKLFTQSQADVAVFGEKDYQQLMVVTRMARDLDLPVRIVPGPTVREPDGLAMSSRNRYLDAEARQRAPLLHAVLTRSAERLRAGETLAPVLDEGRRRIADGGFALEYLEARNAETLAPLAGSGQAIRLLVAARLGETRLIDNVAV